ncbi:hypothetical protein TELCIR_18977, partial [Teladorsagia circumcincta]
MPSRRGRDESIAVRRRHVSFALRLIDIVIMSRRGDLDAKVYIGGLPHDATSQEIEDTFHRFGRIRKVWVARRPPGFAFVEFEDTRDAEDAVKSLDGARICGVRARVELSHGRALAVALPHVVEHLDRVLQMTEGASA